MGAECRISERLQRLEASRCGPTADPTHPRPQPALVPHHPADRHCRFWWRLLVFPASRRRRSADRRRRPPPALPVTTAKPLVKKIIEWDEFTGQFDAVDSVEIRARVSGYLTIDPFHRRPDRSRRATCSS